VTCAALEPRVLFVGLFGAAVIIASTTTRLIMWRRERPTMPEPAVIV
jgi:hypothetical protein